MNSLLNQIDKISKDFYEINPELAEKFLTRLKAGYLTRDENKASHFCVYFLPYNKKERKVFIVHHKKSGLWLFPGGHIDKGEQLLSTLNREICEELGVNQAFDNLPKPFLISVTPIENPIQPCKEHLDIWFLFETDGAGFKVSQFEFFKTQWVTFEEARNILKDTSNLQALNAIINPIN